MSALPLSDMRELPRNVGFGKLFSAIQASQSRRSNMRKRNSVCWALLGLVIAAPFAFARLPPLPQPLDPILQDMFDKRRAMGGAIINYTHHRPCPEIC